MQSPHDIQEQLRVAFPSEPIDAADAFSDWGTTYPDAAAYASQLAGKTWPQLDRTYIERRSDALGFLGTRHLVAVLPVYLSSMIADGTGSPAAGMLMIVLARPLPEEDTGLGHARFDALVEAMSDTQKSAVACALDAFAAQDPDGSLGRAARAALDGFWNRYLPR